LDSTVDFDATDEGVVHAPFRKGDDDLSVTVGGDGELFGQRCLVTRLRAWKEVILI